MGRLDAKLAVITGASSGIGECIARHYAREGASVVISARGIDKARAVAESIVSAGGTATAIACDVASDDSVSALHQEVNATLGAPNVVVNCAGVYRISRFLDTPLETYKTAINVNYFGVIRMMQAFLPQMLEAGYGKIVNVASTAGKAGSTFAAHYNGSKHAVVGITRSLAIEYAKSGININAICPGWAQTPMLDQGIQEFADVAGVSFDEARNLWISRIPQGRFLDPDEVGPLAVYLASSESDGMTGQSMVIAGGMVMT